jgi:arylsulfatase A-like enzyme
MAGLLADGGRGTGARSRIDQPVTLAVAVGLLGAGIELAVLAFRGGVLGSLVRTDLHVVWLTPAAWVLIFATLGASLWLAHRNLPRLFGARIVLLAILAAAAFGVLWLFRPRLHSLAIVVLAAGIAAELSRRLAPRAAALAGIARRVTVSGLIAIVLLAAVLFARGMLLEHRFLSALPGARAGMPNVLFIVLDTVRASSMSLYGYARATTPRLEAFARHAIRFDNAIATAPWTLPSHATFFTGRYPTELSANWTTPLDDTYPSVTEVFADNGYATGAFVANVEYASRRAGLGRGFARFEDYRVNFARLIMSSSLSRFVVSNPRMRDLFDYREITGRKRAPDVNRAFLEWSAAQQRPWFAFLNYYDAHEPYLPPAPFAATFGVPTDPPAGWQAPEDRESVEQQRIVQAAYDASIAYLDAQLGALFDELERRGALANTIVVITSDHGELLGEHRLYSHGNSLYLPLLRVPLLVAMPSTRAAPRTRSDFVTLRDLAVTMLELAGLRNDAGLPGRSLIAPAEADPAPASPILASVDPAPNQLDWYPSSRGSMRSLIHAPYQYIRYADGGEELYDIVADPGQQRNLAGDSTAMRVLTRFRSALPE